MNTQLTLCRVLLATICALAALGSIGSTAAAQSIGANHAGRASRDTIRCASGKPEVAIAACSNIISDQREPPENRASALRTRASSYQQQGDLDRAIDLIVYQSAREPRGDSIYHPTLVGPDFFHKTGGVL